MHTFSMTVKDKRVAQGDATRTALVDAARQLFGEQGYVETSNDEIVALAGLTKGALYHHFKGKEDLFQAVFEQVQREVTDRAVAEFLDPDSWEALVRGCTLWVDAHLDPAVRRIALHDARAVLGWETVRDIEKRALQPLALLLLGALREGCLYIADADNSTQARYEVIELFTEMLSAFRTPQEAQVSGDEFRRPAPST
jgi:AcrR family transcriptional regulator